jgi:hypothetical protein
MAHFYELWIPLSQSALGRIGSGGVKIGLGREWSSFIYVFHRGGGTLKTYCRFPKG